MDKDKRLLALGNRIKQRREALGMSQETLALGSGYKSRASINKIELGKTDIGQRKIADIATALNTTPAYLMGWEDNLPSDAIPYKPTGQVPILGSIPAGIACLAVEDIEGYITVDIKNPEECFALRVKGDSMINAGISPGDLVIVRTQNYADNGQIVACRINGDESTLKRFTKQGDTVVLMPENPQYPVQIVKASDFEDGSASIIGVALQAVKML